MRSLIYLLGVALLLTNVSGITEDEKYVLESLHNTFRQMLTNCEVWNQPPAKNLAPLEWDEELAQKAQTVSDRCVLEHDRDEERRVSKFPSVGQNLVAAPAVDRGFFDWYDEYINYNFKENKCSGVCEHYLQLAWEKTTHVGCGVTNCTGKPDFPQEMFIVCNYGPGGNVKDARPYKRGSSEVCKGKAGLAN